MHFYLHFIQFSEWTIKSLHQDYAMNREMGQGFGVTNKKYINSKEEERQPKHLQIEKYKLE